MSRAIALLGLSGIGKSTLVARLQEQLPVLHLQASALIKAEQAHRAARPDSSEALRLGAVLDNQALMTAAFRRIAATSTLSIVLDAHSIVDGRYGLVEIPSEVFAALGLATICFVKADPAVIVQRRLADTERNRPILTADVVASHQVIARAAAERIAEEIGCPFIEIGDDDLGRLLELVN